MDSVNQMLGELAGLVWGPPLIVWCVGSGLYFLILSRGVQVRYFAHAVQVVLGKFDNADDPGAINHFQALSTALSATIGLGNIAGVAWAITTGGPGAMVWMWLIGAIGMGTKFFTCTLAVKYRRIDETGQVHGGPMYYIEQGLGKAWKPLAVAFALFVMAATFGGGNMFQSNQAAVALDHYFGVPKWVSGLALAVLVALVIIGGIKRIGNVASRIVPFMCLLYIAGALVIIVMHISMLPDLFVLIFKDAFTGQAVAGGAIGAVIQQGVRRGVFSNEAGLGSAPIAHAAAKTEEPIREGFVAMLGPFIDTLVVCTMTALVITISGIYADGDFIARAAENSDLKGVIVTAEAFNQSIPGFGKFLVTAAVSLF
ncbi:sodium:alanine symporter family protein, partial [bacterium]|nr:sodium:alanine symporter family protein [bacterium]